MNKLINLIKFGYVSLNKKDTDAYPSYQVTFNGKPKDVIRLEPYGTWSMPPAGSLAVCFSSLGQESTVFSMANDYLNRPKNLKEGEVLHGAFKFGAFSYYQDSGQTSLVGTKLYLGSETVSVIDKLRGILAAIQVLTVPTAVGPSGVPINAADFLAIDVELAAIEGDAPSVS